MEQHKNYNEISKTEDVVEEVVEEAAVKKETKKRSKKEVKETSTITCANRLNVRSSPSPDAKIICTLKNKDEVLVDSVHDLWLKIVTSSGIEGYVLKTYVKV